MHIAAGGKQGSHTPQLLGEGVDVHNDLWSLCQQALLRGRLAAAASLVSTGALLETRLNDPAESHRGAPLLS